MNRLLFLSNKYSICSNKDLKWKVEYIHVLFQLDNIKTLMLLWDQTMRGDQIILIFQQWTLVLYGWNNPTLPVQLHLSRYSRNIWKLFISVTTCWMHRLSSMYLFYTTKNDHVLLHVFRINRLDFLQIKNIY